MSRLPTPPVQPSADELVSKPEVGQTGLHTIGSIPSAPSGMPSIPAAEVAQTAAPVANVTPPLPLAGVVTTATGETGVFISEQQILDEVMKENHTLPVAVAVLCGGLTLVIYAAQGLAQAGPVGAIGMGVLMGVVLAVSVVLSTFAAWVVSKMFGEDFGSLSGLLLRVSAVVAAQFLLFLGLTAVIGPILAILASVPILLALSVWLLGMNLFQAFVFAVLLKMIEWVLIAFVAFSIASAMLA